jgi:hypothetical protein
MNRCGALVAAFDYRRMVIRRSRPSTFVELTSDVAPLK